MRLVRVRTSDGTRDGVLDADDRVLLLSGGRPDRFDLDDLVTRAGRELADPTTEPTGLDQVSLAAPVQPGKVVCVGLNYADHAAEGGQAAPAEPILFLKNADTVVGPYDDVSIPPGSVKTDWEVELGVVIGRTAGYLGSIEDAAAHIGGYVLVDDVSERRYQLELGGQWDKGKNCPTFCPIGPWLLTADEVADPQTLRLGLDVNDDVLQDSSTAEMIFGVHHLVHYVSQFMTLYPGDVISTGTPAGVGAGQHPPRYLSAGDRVRAWAEGLGEQRSHFVATSEPC